MVQLGQTVGECSLMAPLTQTMADTGRGKCLGIDRSMRGCSHVMSRYGSGQWRQAAAIKTIVKMFF